MRNIYRCILVYWDSGDWTYSLSFVDKCFAA